MAIALSSGPALPTAVHAGPSPADIERARELYDNGRTLYEEGSWDGAILAFEAAFELSADINLLYNISLAYDRKGDYQQAIAYLDRYRALAAEDERSKLEHRRKVLEARLKKQKDEEAKREAETPDLEEPDQPPEPQPPPGQKDEPERERLFGPGAWALTGIGIAGYAVGIGLGASSLTRTRAAQTQCADGNGPVLCMDTARPDVRRAKNHAIGADVGFAVGAAATLAVIIIVAVKASRRKKSQTAHVIPGGVQVRF
jgi:tetratricopeptide (TPR) repeat protein